MGILVPPFMSGFLAAGIMALVSAYVFSWDSTAVVVASIVAGVLVLILVSMVMRIIGTTQNVIFLSYLELRDRFYAKHPEIVAELENKFRARYPDISFNGMAPAGAGADPATGV